MVKGFERERQDFFLFVNTNTRYNSKCMQTVDLLQTSIKIELELDKMSSFYYQLQFIVRSLWMKPTKLPKILSKDPQHYVLLLQILNNESVTVSQ